MAKKKVKLCYHCKCNHKRFKEGGVFYSYKESNGLD